MGRHIKKDLRLGVLLAEHGKSAVILRTGLGGDALGHLLLDHDGDGLEALRFQHCRQNGRSDLIGQIGTGHGPQAGEFLRHQGGNILVQHIVPDNLQVVKFPYGLFQNGCQPLIQLHGADL